jgi:anti-anti-sigma factor
LREAISAALDGEGKVIVDLHGVTFIDSQGLKVLVDAYKRAQPSRAERLVLRAPRPQARKVLEITGLADRLPIED